MEKKIKLVCVCVNICKNFFIFLSSSTADLKCANSCPTSPNTYLNIRNLAMPGYGPLAIISKTIQTQTLNGSPTIPSVDHINSVLPMEGGGGPGVRILRGNGLGGGFASDLLHHLANVGKSAVADVGAKATDAALTRANRAIQEKLVCIFYYCVP